MCRSHVPVVMVRPVSGLAPAAGVSVLTAALAITAGCGPPPQSDHKVGPVSSAMSFPLVPLPAVARQVCAKTQKATAFPVLCPTALPNAPNVRPPLRVLAHVSRGRFYDLDFSYGVPGRSAIGAYVPFLHFVVARQNSVQGGGPPPPRAKPATVGGRRGLLLPADGRGGWYGDHLRFFWRDAEGRRYVITLHDIGPETQLLLSELVRDLRPARRLTRQ